MLHNITIAGERPLQITYWYKEVEGTRPLLLLHGHGGDHRGLVALARAIPVTAYILDLPGFGESDELEEHSIEAYAAAVEQFASAHGFKAYDVLGHSLGSAFALAIAVNDSRVQKLILVNPIPEFAKFVRSLIQLVGTTATSLPPRLGEALVHTRLYNVATFLLHSRKKQNIEHAAKYLRLQNSTKYSLKAWQESGSAIFAMNQQDFARKIAIPTLVIHGNKDKMTSSQSVEEFANLFTNATLVQLKKAGHFVPLEYVDEAVYAVDMFIKNDGKA
jgi:pimeloyl-ACP methyl ester carboxylesterase